MPEPRICPYQHPQFPLSGAIRGIDRRRYSVRESGSDEAPKKLLQSIPSDSACGLSGPLWIAEFEQIATRDTFCPKTRASFRPSFTPMRVQPAGVLSFAGWCASRMESLIIPVNVFCSPEDPHAAHESHVRAALERLKLLGASDRELAAVTHFIIGFLHFLAQSRRKRSISFWRVAPRRKEHKPQSVLLEPYLPLSQLRCQINEAGKQHCHPTLCQ